jgi:hypothetical protein
MVWGLSRILEELVYERFDISDKCQVIHISFILHVLEIQRFMMGFRSVNLIPFEGRTSQVGHRNDLLFQREYLTDRKRSLHSGGQVLKPI